MFGTLGTRLTAFRWPIGGIAAPELSVPVVVCARVAAAVVALPMIVEPAVAAPPVLIPGVVVPPTEFVAGVVDPWLDDPVAGIEEPAAASIAMLVAEMGLAALAPGGIDTAEPFMGVVTPGA